VQGERPLPVRIINAYVAKVFHAAQADATVSVAFQRVSHLLASPPTLMRPGMMWRVFRAARTRLPAGRAVADAVPPRSQAA
jgi:hypothetical protein